MCMNCSSPRVLMASEKLLFFNAVLGSNVFSGKVIFAKGLQQILSRGVLFKMEEDQCPKLIFEGHFEITVSFSFEFGHIFHGVERGLNEFEKRNGAGSSLPRVERTRHV